MHLFVRLVTAATVATSLSCASTAPTTARVPAPPTRSIVLDGDLSDWAGIPVWTEATPLSAPSPSAGAPPVTLRRAWATDDAAWWYLSVEVSDSVNVMAMPGTMHLLIDADEQATTGATVFTMPGVDFAVDLSRSDKRQGNGYGAGAALRTVGAGGLNEHRSPYDNELLAMPSWSSPRFELRIARAGHADGFAALGSRVRAQLVFEAANGAVHALPPASYRFTTPKSPVPAPAVSTIPKVAVGATRIAQWNVSEGSFRKPARHAVLLAAVEPHVIMLDEVYNEISDAILADFFSLPALAALGRWEFVHSVTGGRQKTVIASRVGAVRPAATMRRVEYDTGALDSLRLLVPDPFKHAMDIEAAAQLSSTGAWITIDGLETLFVPLDLQSAGYHQSGQDKLRILQSRTLRARVMRELATGARRAPVVIGGDFNTVGSFAPLGELMHGLDTDSSDLAIGDARRLGDPTVATWASATVAQFSPGRLDFTLFSDAVFERTGGFVFSSTDLAPAFATSKGLTPDLSPETSDHMIVVTDLRRRRGR